jgi:serine/threonine protein kinase
MSESVNITKPITIADLYLNEKYNNYRGKNLEEDYEYSGELEGDTSSSFGSVSLYKNIEEGKKYVVKKMILNDDKNKITTCFNDLEMSIKITDILCKEANNKLICLKNHYMKDNNLYLVIEYYENSIDLFQFIKNLQFTESKNKNNTEYINNYLEIINKIMVLIYNGINLIHKQGILHLDIKLENILIICNKKLTFDNLESELDLDSESGLGIDIRIIDFGFSCDMVDEVCRKPVGTPNYIAPEMFNKFLEVGEHSDVYSLGVLYFYMLFQDFPYFSVNNEINNKIYEKLSYYYDKNKYELEHYWNSKILSKIYFVSPENIINRNNIYNEESLEYLNKYYYWIIYPSLITSTCDRIKIDEIIKLLSFK